MFVMTSNLASDEIAGYGIQLRHEAQRMAEQRETGTLGKQSYVMRSSKMSLSFHLQCMP